MNSANLCTTGDPTFKNGSDQTSPANRQPRNIGCPSRGDLCLAEIAFTDASSSKVRPVLVLGVDGTDLIVAPLTTRLPLNDSEVELFRWAESGLLARSTVRCARIGPVAQSLVVSVVGRVLPEDWKRVSHAATRWFAMIIS